MKRRALLALLGAVGVVATLGGPAGADGPPVERPEQRAHVQISAIHALKTDGGGSIDPRLRDLPQLTRDQPFVRYNVYKLLDRKDMPVSVGQPVPYQLLNGRTMQVKLTQVGVEGGATRYHVRVEIDEPGKQPVAVEVTAGPKDPFFVAGHSYEGGTLFLELVMQGS